MLIQILQTTLTIGGAIFVVALMWDKADEDSILAACVGLAGFLLAFLSIVGLILTEIWA